MDKAAFSFKCTKRDEVHYVNSEGIVLKLLVKAFNDHFPDVVYIYDLGNNNWKITGIDQVLTRRR